MQAVASIRLAYRHRRREISALCRTSLHRPSQAINEKKSHETLLVAATALKQGKSLASAITDHVATPNGFYGYKAASKGNAANQHGG